MLTFLNEFIVLSLLIPCFVCKWNTDDYFRREHSLIRPYFGSTMQNWKMSGMAFASDTQVRLTPDIKSAMGGIWNRHPVNLRNWELELQFKIHGSGKDLYGDGMAIWYVRDSNECPGDPQCIVFGGRDYFVGLAVFIDTYDNQNSEHDHGHPYVSAMVNNGSVHYDHDSDGTHTEVAGCSASARLKPNEQRETRLKVRYQHDTLTVYTDVDRRGAWHECFNVPGVLLPTGYHLGVTAATGDLSDNHDLLALRFYQLEDQDQEDEEDRRRLTPSASIFAAPRDHVDDRKSPAMGGFSKLLLWLVGLAMVGGAIYIGFNFHAKNRRSRFY